MKGIAHFATGLSVASCIPDVVGYAEQGSLLIALGGAAAMLPDFLDFRFARFLERRDADIAPEGRADDAQRIADAFAAEVALARAGHPRVVQLHPLRLSVANWVTYGIALDAAHHEIVVTLGSETARATAGLLGATYDGGFEVGELGGPSLRLSVGADGAVSAAFLPWHRTWSHSLVLAAALGCAVAPIGGVLAGIVSAAGFAAHVLEDQLGYLGSNLFWPFTRVRRDGLKLLHSGDAIPNALTVWLSLMLLLFNLDRARVVPSFDALAFVTFAMALPAVGFITLYAQRRARGVFVPTVEKLREQAAEERE